MRRFVVALLTVALVGIGPPALAVRREPSPDSGKGCSLEHWQLVVEHDRFRLCLIGREG